MGNNFFSGLTPEVANSLNQILSSALGAPGAAPMVANGVIPAARLVFITDASNADTIAIGGHTFTFLTALIAAGATTQVTRGVSAAATRASLINAINGVTDATVVKATTPFSQPIVADQVGTSVRIRLASVQGGAPVTGTAPTMALAEGLTPAASVWNCANLNVSGRSVAATGIQTCTDSVVITAQMIAATTFVVELPFTAVKLTWNAQTSTGAERATTDTIALSSGSILITMAGGASPALQAGDIVEFVATT